MAFGAVFFAPAFADDSSAAKETTKPEAAKHGYIGAKKCMMCHKKGNVYASWLETKHAKAWEALKPEEQKNEKCVACHSTGMDVAGELLTEVQCEACHGPGSDYWKSSIMKDRKAAIANGLIMPDEKTCKKCHNENVPAQFASKTPFDFAKMKAAGVHDLPSASEPKPTGK